MGQHTRPGKLGRATIIAMMSGASIVTAVALAAQIVFFMIRSSTQGAALVHAERGLIASAGRGGAAACVSAPAIGPGPDGLLQAPSLGLTAPVLQGTDDAVLDDAVGHVSGSAWPGQPGTSVLAAHDVTWFSRITQLKHGDIVRYVTPCRTYTYRVTSHAVVRAGSAVYSTRDAGLVLDTCYPLDALYITSSRYLVYATLVESSPTHPFGAASSGPSAVVGSLPAPLPSAQGDWPVPRVPAPAALAAQGLSLAQNDAPLGTLGISGTPSRAWRQSSAPLDVEAAALSEYFGLIHSAAQDRHAWWSALAPSLPVSAAGPLWEGQLTDYDSRLSITLSVRGGQPIGATLTAHVTVASAQGSRHYRLTVTETVREGQLLVTGVRLHHLH
jgi:sortase A